MKKGFTLIELLGIIVILAIIALVTTPVILNTIQTAREKAFIDTGYSLISAAKQYQVKKAGQNEELDLIIDYDNNRNIDVITLTGDLPDGGTFKIDENGKTELKLWNEKGKVCITKSKDEKKITVAKENNKKISKEECKLTEETDE